MEPFDVSPGGVVLPRVQIVRPVGLFQPAPAIESLFDCFEREVTDYFKRLLHAPKELHKGIMLMAGSLCNFSSKSLQDLLWGKTAYAGPTTIYGALYTAAIDDTLLGNTANESAYGSYARLSLTNNTTIFATGSGTTTYTKTFPSDAAKTWATSTSGTSTITYLGFLDGNAGTSADKGLAWCTVTSTTINSGDTPQLAQNAVTVVQD
jgi:hypothetical protein